MTRTSDVLESILPRKVEIVSGIPKLADLVVLLMITCFVGRVQVSLEGHPQLVRSIDLGLISHVRQRRDPTLGVKSRNKGVISVLNFLGGSYLLLHFQFE